MKWLKIVIAVIALLYATIGLIFMDYSQLGSFEKGRIFGYIAIVLISGYMIYRFAKNTIQS